MNSIKSHYVYHSLSKNMLIDFKFYLKIENSKSQAKVTGEMSMLFILHLHRYAPDQVLGEK